MLPFKLLQQNQWAYILSHSRGADLGLHLLARVGIYVKRYTGYRNGVEKAVSYLG